MADKAEHTPNRKALRCSTADRQSAEPALFAARLLVRRSAGRGRSRCRLGAVQRLTTCPPDCTQAPMRINIEVLIARAYEAAYPWAHKFIGDRRLPGSDLWMGWPVGDVPAANDERA